MCSSDLYFGGLFKFIYSPLILSSTFNSLATRESLKHTTPLNYEIVREVSDRYLITNKIKQFLSLNRFARYHRDLLIYGLRANNLLEEGYVSRNLAAAKDFILPERYSSNYANLLRQDMKKPLEIMNLDSNSDADGFRLSYAQFPIEFMNNSCYDIVNETGTTYEIEQSLDLIVISEKTAKSLAFGRPFIINGGPGCLSLIKKLGFETCEWLFDESYDNFVDLVDRQELIIKNIMSYKSNMNTLWAKILHHKDILDRNQTKILNFNFENYIVRELTNE